MKTLLTNLLARKLFAVILLLLFFHKYCFKMPSIFFTPAVSLICISEKFPGMFCYLLHYFD